MMLLWSTEGHIKMEETHTHISETPLAKSPVFKIWFQIWSSVFSTVSEEKQQKHLVFSMFSHSKSLSFLNFAALDADEIEKEAQLLLCQGASLLPPLYLWVCSTSGLLASFLNGLDKLSAEGLCIQKKLGIRGKQPYSGLQTSDLI